MSDRIDLPSGGWVQLRDPKTLRAKDKKRAMSNITDHERAVAAGLEATDGLIAVLVTAWEIPYLPNAPLPSVEIGMIGELEIPDYEALVAACGPALRIVIPQAATVEDADKPGSPTVPASA